MGFKISSERAGHFARPISTIGSTAQTGFPQSNLPDYLHPYRPVRSTAAASTSLYFGLDFGADVSIAAIIALNVNVTKVKFQAHSSDSWGTPSHTSSELTVTKDSLTNRYNYIYEPSSWTSNTRFVRVVPSGSFSVTDGTGVLSCGALLVVTTLTTLTTPLADPLTATPVEPVLSVQYTGGATDAIKVGETCARIDIAQSVTSSSNDSEILDLLATNGEAGAFVFFWNNSDTSQVYIVKRQGTAGLTYTGPNARRVNGLTLVEQCQ